jgi:hypothetical protein
MNGRLSCRLGVWSSAFVAVLGAVYLALLGIFFATQGFVFPPPESVQLTAGVITLLTAPALVVVFAAIKHVAGEDGAILGTVGLSFTVLFAATVSINRFVQLTVVRQAPPGAASADLARFLPYSTGSVMFALEMLGWGFFIALAALAVAPLFGGDRLGLAIRHVLVTFGGLSLLSVVGFATQSAITAVGFVAWGPLLLALAVLLTVYFRRAGQMEPSGGGS